MKNKIIIAFLLSFFIVIGFFFITKENSSQLKPKPETSKIRMTTMPVVQGLPFYYAKEKGYFKDAGLDVEFVKFESPNQIIDALLQGKIDFTPPSGATGVVGIAEYKNPGKLKIYAGGGGTKTIQNDAFLVKNDSQITSIKDLKGKKLGIVAGSVQWKTITRYILEKNNLNADKDVTVIEIPLGLQAQALASGEIDALITVEPIPTVIKTKNIGKEIVGNLSSEYISDPFFAGVGIVRSDFAKQNPQTTKKVLEIFDRAITEINNDPDSARQYLKGYTSLDDSMIKIVPISYFRTVHNMTIQDKQALQKFFDIFTTFKIVDGKIDVNKLLYTPE